MSMTLWNFDEETNQWVSDEGGTLPREAYCYWCGSGKHKETNCYIKQMSE